MNILETPEEKALIILKNIIGKWKSLDAFEKNKVAEEIAGKRKAQKFIMLIEDYVQ